MSRKPQYSLGPILTLSLVCLFLIGCSTVGVKVPVMRPAEINLKGKNELVVGQISGRNADKMSAYVKQKAVDSAYFKVIDCKHLNRVMAAFKKISRVQTLLSGISDNVALNHPVIQNTQALSAAASLKQQGLEKRSRTINLHGDTPHGPAFNGAFAKAVSRHDFELNPVINATRFRLTATIVLREGKQIWDQFQYVAAYTYGIEDLWTSNTISSESKALAGSKEVAAQNAVVEAAIDIGLATGKRLEAYLSQNTE